MNVNKYLLLSAIFSGVSLTSQAASMNVLQSENFEGPDFAGYTLTNAGGAAQGFTPTAATDSIRRTSSANAGGFFGESVTGFSGNFIAMEDIDGANAAFVGQEGYLNLSPIVGSHNNLGIGFTIAAPDSLDGRYDVGDVLELQYRVDGGSWVVASETSYKGTGSGLGLFNGPGNAYTAATTVFADLSGVASTTSFEVRAHFISDSQEEMVFDDIIVRGDAYVVPEPSSSLMALLGGVVLCFRRRK